MMACWLATTKLVAGAQLNSDPAARLLRDASLMLLKEGNARYVAGKSQHPHLDSERRTGTVAQGQEPFATILACSDSRSPVELIFDRGIGDLFSVRVAGNIADQSQIASIEYGVEHLHTPLLIVMGHTRCGAVTAVMQGTELHGHLRALGERIKPAVDKVRSETDFKEALPKAIQANVWQAMEDILKQSRGVREKIKANRVHLLGAIYDLEAGTVSWLGSHPEESALMIEAEQKDLKGASTGKPSPKPGAEAGKPLPEPEPGKGITLQGKPH